MERGTYKISLTEAYSCKFVSDSYTFILHQHENLLDLNSHQMINTHINVFSKYADTLETVETLGLQSNNSRNLNELEAEIKDYKETFGTQNYVNKASTISGLSTFGFIILIVAITYGIYRLYCKWKNSKKIDELCRVTT